MLCIFVYTVVFEENTGYTRLTLTTATPHSCFLCSNNSKVTWFFIVVRPTEKLEGSVQSTGNDDIIRRLRVCLLCDVVQTFFRLRFRKLCFGVVSFVINMHRRRDKGLLHPRVIVCCRSVV